MKISRLEYFRLWWWLFDLEKKEKTVKGDWCNLAKDPPTVKSVFSLKHKDEKL